MEKEKKLEGLANNQTITTEKNTFLSKAFSNIQYYRAKLPLLHSLQTNGTLAPLILLSQR
jgi:hypothetical protein